jgi:hypothetical protein
MICDCLCHVRNGSDDPCLVCWWKHRATVERVRQRVELFK